MPDHGSHNTPQLSRVTFLCRRVGRLAHFLLLIFILPAGSGAQDVTLSTLFGELRVSVWGLNEQPPLQDDENHLVAMRVRFENVGGAAICQSFSAILRTTSDLEYRPVPRALGGEQPEMRELSPSRRVEGLYVFRVKNGVRPLHLTLRSSGESQSCGPTRERTYVVAREMHFDLVPLGKAAASRETPRPEPDRIFVTSTDPSSKTLSAPAKPAKPGTLALFAKHCSAATVTLDRNRAGYTAVVDPAGSKSSKNGITVFNAQGDVVYRGGNMRLDNAVKDACAAIRKDFKRQKR